jgi:hypothetical protein
MKILNVQLSLLAIVTVLNELWENIELNYWELKIRGL